ncbi:beta strand repeat-containing protein [Vannielia litorea]|uniref:beta strand repeat-containing protein n=1 Tax=Vannielia litorea TaxID=1217970 RepID=UPI001C96B4E1|nr:autotransporter outer membrane beta-barrel domain-containing protein [Vannielia litorea]MBY6048669.1 autotransporter outer membrane beta-barrel domain-containing protein [Vannielia litorea]MBY6076083.1 autotransporter outer membrane beta-barrel domain-containing protein [Vannielia litorea]
MRLRGRHLANLKGTVASFVPCMCLALVAAFAASHEAQSESLTWDSDPVTAGIQSGGGSWLNGAVPNWQDDTSANVEFSDGDDLTFRALGGATAEIDLGDNVAPGSMTFESGGYSIVNSDADTNSINVTGVMGITVDGGAVTIEAMISNQGTVTIGGAGTLTLSGANIEDGVAAAGTYAINGGNLVITGSTAAEDSVVNNNGTLLLNGGGTVLGTVTNIAGSFTNADGDAKGLTTVVDGSVLATGGDFTGGVQLNNGMMIIQADTAAGGISVGTGLLLVQDGNTLDSGLQMTGNGDIDNYGTVEGNVNLFDGTFENGFGPSLQTGNVDGAVTLNGSGATFNNYDGSSVGNLVTVNAGSLNAAGGSFADILVNGGTMAVFADTQANVMTIQSGDIDILSGQELDATLNVEGGEVENFGTMDGTVTVTSGTFNNGDISGVPSGTVAGDVIIDGASGTFNNYVGSDVTGSVTIDNGDGDPATGGTLNGNGGTFGDVIVNDGRFNVNASTQADNVTNGGGNIAIDGAGITLQTNYNQTGGTTVIANGGVLEDADGLTVSGGELQNDIGGTITGDVAISGGELLADGGTFNDDVTVSGSGTFNVDANTSVGTTTITGGDIDIAGGATLDTQLVQSGGTTTINVNGQLDDAADALVDLSGGRLINRGLVADDIELTGDATLVADGGVFGGEITMLSADAVFDVSASTLIVSPITVTNGTVSINGTSTLTNDIDLGNGSVSVGANATLNDVGGTNLVAGTLVNAGTVTQQVTVSDGGSLDIAGGIFTNGVVANGGNILISEDAALDLTNNGSDIELQSGQTLTDDMVQNDGTFTSSGTLNGTLLVTGGTFTQNPADPSDPVGGVTGAVTVTGGQFVANSGVFGLGITAETNGNVEVGGAVTGDVTNNGGTVTVLGSGSLSGDLANSGIARSTGEITGDVDNSGTLELEGTLAGSLENDGAGTVTTTGTVSGITTLTQDSTGLVTVSDGDTLSAQTITITSGSAGIAIGAGATLEGVGNSMTNASAMTVGAAGTLRDAGVITNQSGASILFEAGGFLIGDSDASGDEDILNDGTISVGGGSLNVTLGGAGAFSNANLLALASGSSMTVSGRFANSGTINMQNGTTGETVTVNGTYDGGGAMLIDVDFAAATADRMLVNGDVTGGSTTISLNDVSSGTASGNDIIIASVSGTSAADAFVLDAPLSLGALVYDIEQVGSDFVLGASGAFVAEVVGLEALATTLIMQSDLPSLSQRSGLAMTGEMGAFGQTKGAWFIIDAGTSRFAPVSSGTDYRGETKEFRLRGGVNLGLVESDAGQLVVGANLSLGSAETDLKSDSGPASITTDALSAGLSATWYGNSGFYLDSQLQYTTFDSTVMSGGAESSTEGESYAGAVEIGKRMTVAGTGWTLTPRGQVRYATVEFDDFASGGGLDTSLDNAESLRVGLGLNAEHAAPSGEGLTLYGSAMIYRELADGPTTTIAGTPVVSEAEDWTGEFGLGVRHGFGNGRGSLFGEVSYETGFEDPGNKNSLSLMLGGQMTF